MALWKISVKNSGNVACKDKRQKLEYIILGLSLVI